MLCIAGEGWGNHVHIFGGFFPVVVTAFHFHLKISKHPDYPCRGLLFLLLSILYLEDFLKEIL